MLEISQVNKHYPTPRGPLTVLTDVSLALSPGQAAAITGPSGSGKSSLLYIMGGLEPPSEGEVRLGGKNLNRLKPAELADFRNAQIGFVFQDHCLLPQCSVLENVLIPTLVSPADNFLLQAKSLIEQVGLTERIDHRPGELSGGEKQRVAIARALIRQPKLVLCDEPTGNLDPESAGAVASLLLDLHRRHRNILVVVTHSMQLACQFPVRFELTGNQLNRIESQ